MAQTYEGFVKWFNNDKGYGFLSRQDGDDVFCHYSAINAGGFKTLQEDQKVRFEIEQGPKGLQAINVVRALIYASGTIKLSGRTRMAD